MEFPPSPAASDCDSLDGIDLDVYLALQGPISGLPTPPMERKSVETCRLAAEEAEDTADRKFLSMISRELLEISGLVISMSADTDRRPSHSTLCESSK